MEFCGYVFFCFFSSPDGNPTMMSSRISLDLVTSIYTVSLEYLGPRCAHLFVPAGFHCNVDTGLINPLPPLHQKVQKVQKIFNRF